MGSSRDEIAANLRTAIASGEYKPGDKLPSRRALSEQYGAAPNTVGAALQVLATEGCVSLRTKSVAVVLEAGDSQRTPESRMADARGELLAVRDAVHDVQLRISELGRQVSEALSKLGE